MKVLILVIIFLNNLFINAKFVEGNRWRPKVKQEEHYKRKVLSVDEYFITQEQGSERRYTGLQNSHNKTGYYNCKVCDETLFSSKDKYDSKMGWPSFTAAHANVVEMVDAKPFLRHMHQKRIQAKCENCGSHLGFVFDDGPEDKGSVRYSINSACLKFKRGRVE